MENNGLNLDDRGILLLQELLKDASQKDTELGKKIGVVSSTVGKRKREMKDSGLIKKFTCTLDYDVIGYKTTAIVLLSCKSQADIDMKKFEKQISGIEAVVELFKVAGIWDYYVKIVTKSNKEYHEVIELIMRLDNFKNSLTEVVLDAIVQRDRIDTTKITG